ncbi:MAG: type II toxin-antitoxin system HipA family toxin [Candidatus Melainabacteria bacterium]|nr:type II toxin-antitoxin system HipA family toxin [Candidatus Melainabacteria bacterium]
MINELEIKIWDDVAAYAAYKDSNLVYFEYSKDFPLSYELSPVVMPRVPDRVWSFDLNQATYHGLPGLLADSLPDSYGQGMMDAWFSRSGVSLGQVNSLDRLSYLGTRAMGALEFYPNQENKSKNGDLEIDQLLDISSKILQSRLGFELDEDDVNRVIQIGSSAGGARAKAVIAYNPETGMIRSGQVDNPGFENYIIKLDGVSNEALLDPQGYTNIEYAYYLMARDSGIEMSDSLILEKQGRNHFLTKRFDRKADGSKLHMQTLCALAHLDYNSPRVYSYEFLFRLAQRLELPMQDKEQIFKLMVFNVVGRNHDDHTKNFSFLMDRDARWRLAPAYDLTYAFNPKHHWLKEHNLLINAKSTDIRREDLMVYAKQFYIKKAEEYIEAILAIFSKWKDYAQKAKVCKNKAKEIKNNLNMLDY